MAAFEKKHTNTLLEIYNLLSTVDFPSLLSQILRLNAFLSATIRLHKMNIKKEIELFLTKISNDEIEIYNEISLQHELGIFLRSKTKGQKVQFERNISFFGMNKSKFVKKEIDLSIFENENTPDFAIELKFPKNGQFPEQMFHICKDIRFAEQLKSSGFKETYVLALADHHNFYQGKSCGIYKYFREGENNPISGTITKPTGKKNQELRFDGTYIIKWHKLQGGLHSMIIKI